MKGVGVAHSRLGLAGASRALVPRSEHCHLHNPPPRLHLDARLLGLFLVAFFLRRVGGSAVFFAAVIAQALVIVMYFSLNIGYLWYNLIGCAACIALSVALQAVLPPRAGVNEVRR